ncbi:MAG: response regulator [Halioglobus sp.]
MNQTLLLVDDHPLFRRGVRDLIINQCSIYENVIEADNGGVALNMIKRFAPKCVMLDISMPGIDGLRTLEMIKQQYPQTQCVIMSMYDKQEFVVDARSKGAQGYILKTDSDNTILECLRSVENGRDYVSSSLSSKLEQALPEPRTSSKDLECLTRREKQVLALIAKNHTSKEIAQQLTLSLRTVQNHRVNICKKLHITGSNALLKIAIENQAWL